MEEEGGGLISVLANDRINVHISRKPTSGDFVTPSASLSIPSPVRL